ncbi:MAG: OmpA family protein [Sulfurovum sp.]|nr:OmpA family protein [Sulfurovum sp.]
MKHLFYLLFTITFLVAQEKSYPDGHGGRIVLPYGDLSFADRVVSFDKKSTYQTKNHEVNRSLGVADRKSLSLTCGGVLVLAFEDNVLVDIEGNDLHVFERGHKVEKSFLSISVDGKTWIEIGEVEGGMAEVDISAHVSKNDSFSFVRLTDLKSACKGPYAGADIDAVAAIGSQIKLSLSSAVLFDLDSYILKKEAHQVIHTLIKKLDYKEMKLSIEGHTDSIGTKAYNQILSLQRANAVRQYLVEYEHFILKNMRIVGHGELVPLLKNTNAEQRAKNRRVELLFTH